MALVRLVQMPFAAVERPSIGLSLLAAALERAGVEAGVSYANLAFAERVGLAATKMIDSTRNDDLIGEWVFSRAAFPDFHPDEEHYLEIIDLAPAARRMGSQEAVLAYLHRLRDEAAAFVEHVAQQVVAEAPRILGISSMFQQHCASLALARRVKALAPDTVVMMGGANCEGVMGRATFEAFPDLDYVVCGEADDIVVGMVERILAGETFEAPGVYGPAHRLRHDPPGAPRPQVRDLDRIPTPDYRDYFRSLRESPLAPAIRPGLLVETSRGCWWGAAHHCTFCGLNGSGMNFREKSAGRVIEELAELSEAYGLRNFEITDNILSMKYFKTALPDLAKVEPPYTIFAETKSNLRREHVQRLAEAGIRWIQPGIESMHDDILRHIDKGTTALINVQLLKWAREFGIAISWNYLYGFPGERDAWYAEVAEWIPLVFHLQPPQAMLPVRFDRFSPYQTRPADFGLDLAPNRAYRYIFPLDEAQVADFAYFFQTRAQAREEAPPDWPPSRKSNAHAALDALVTQWLERFWSRLPAILSMSDDGERLRFYDTRPCAPSRQQQLEGEHRRIYLECITSRSAASFPGAEPILDELCARKLMMKLNGHYLSLAVPGEMPRILRPTEFPGGTAGLPAGVAAAVPDARMPALVLERKS